jgi:uncharacterized protein YabE (DUF348 family)
MVPIVTFAVLLLVSLGGWWLLARDDTPVTDAYVVIITHDHAEQTVPSREPTVGALLKKLNLTLNEGDVVEPSAQTKIKQDDFRINIYRAVPIEIIDGTQHTFTFSAATTSRSIARQAGIATYAEDNLTIKPVDNFVSQEAIGEQVVIDRATPININLYGTPTVVRTHAKTVADLMKEKGIKLAKDDQVTPALSTPLVDNQQLFVTRNGTKIESVTESIPAPTQAIDDPTLAFGTSAIRQQGSDGQQITTYQDALQNGVVVSRTLIQTVVTQQPVTQIAVRGTSLSGIRGDMALAGVSPDDYEAADYIISHESGWCTTKAQGEHDCPVVPDNQFTSGGYGLCQATPGNKMSSAGADWATNPITQIRWCSGYAAGRYGGWSGAYNHWLNYHNW